MSHVAFSVFTNFISISGGCYKCHCQFALEEKHYQRLVETGESFYCPNGHPQAFMDSAVKKLERELQFQKNQVSYYNQRLESEKRSHSATKGQITKIKNRVGAGVCPCCNRHFTNLQRHMECKHKDFKGDKKK